MGICGVGVDYRYEGATHKANSPNKQGVKTRDKKPKMMMMMTMKSTPSKEKNPLLDMFFSRSRRKKKKLHE